MIKRETDEAKRTACATAARVLGLVKPRHLSITDDGEVTPVPSTKAESRREAWKELLGELAQRGGGDG